MDRRLFLICLLVASVSGLSGQALAKDGDGSGGGSGNSGPGGGDDSDDSDNSGPGGGDDDDDDDDDQDDDSNRKRDEVAAAVARGEIAPVKSVLKAALAHTPGKVLDVKLRQRLFSKVYVVKILTPAGRKRELQVDAKSLKILRSK